MIYYKAKKDKIKTNIWKKRILTFGLSAIAFFLISFGMYSLQEHKSISVLNTPQTSNKSNNISSNESKILTISGFRVGLYFSEIVDKLPSYAAIDLQESLGETYYDIRFDQQQLTFNNNGLLKFILTAKTGSGLDNGIMVGDQESLIKDKMGIPKIPPENIDKKFYQYLYPTYQVHFYTKNGNIDTIRMIDEPSKEPVQKSLADDGQKILAFYTGKMSANDVKVNTATNQDPKSEKMTGELTENTNIKPNIVTQPEVNKKETYDKAKLVETAKQVKTYWVKYLDILSSDKTKNQMTEELKELEKSAGLWDLSIKLEEHVTVSSGDRNLYKWLVQFADAIGTAIDFMIVDFTRDVNDPINSNAYSKHHEAEAKTMDLIMYYRNFFGNDI